MKVNKRPITDAMVEAAAISLFTTDEVHWLCGFYEADEASRDLYRLRGRAALLAARTAEVPS